MNGGAIPPRRDPREAQSLIAFAQRYDRERDAWAELSPRHRESLFEELLEQYRALYARVVHVSANTQMSDADRVEALKWIPGNFPNLG